MRYFLGLLIPALLQSLLVWVAVEMNTGNGSWVGLGAFLIGLVAIPATALINLIYIRSNKDSAAGPVIARCFVIAMIAPLCIAVLFAVG